MIQNIKTQVITHSQHEEKHVHGRTTFDKALTIAGITGAAISISPLIMEKAGIGRKEFDFFAHNCCPVIEKNGISLCTNKDGIKTYGIAGAISAGLDRIPVVGGTLSKGGIESALTSGGLMIFGHQVGGLIRGGAPKGSFRARLAGITSTTLQLFGLVIALPAILPSVGHGLAYISSTIGIDKIDYEGKDSTGPATALMGVLGKVPGECKSTAKLNDGAYGSIGVLCCLANAVIPSISTIFSANNKQSSNEIIR